VAVGAAPPRNVFVRDRSVRRGARAEEPGTTVLALGGEPGEAFRVSPWGVLALRQAAAQEPKVADWSSGDSDLDPIRDDTRFESAVAGKANAGGETA
jgi:hypothetical protein